MNEVMTIDQITSEFRDEWILIGDMQMDEQMRLRGGRVLRHSKDREQVDEFASKLPLGTFTVINTIEEPIIITRLIVGFVEED